MLNCPKLGCENKGWGLDMDKFKSLNRCWQEKGYCNQDAAFQARGAVPALIQQWEKVGVQRKNQK